MKKNGIYIYIYIYICHFSFSYIYIYIYIYIYGLHFQIYALKYILKIFFFYFQNVTAAAGIMQSSSNELSTLVSGKVKNVNKRTLLSKKKKTRQNLPFIEKYANK